MVLPYARKRDRGSRRLASILLWPNHFDRDALPRKAMLDPTRTTSLHILPLLSIDKGGTSLPLKAFKGVPSRTQARIDSIELTKCAHATTDILD